MREPRLFIPSQGFRHAATLLLTKAVRSLRADASQESVCALLDRLAHEAVALADDMRAPPASSEWLVAELHATIDRLPHTFDRDAAKSIVAAVVTRVAARTPDVPERDLFLVYAAEDRIPVAAPLAIELTKRRVSVAFADYEAATADQWRAALEDGLARHRGGAILLTAASERFRPAMVLGERVRMFRCTDINTTVSELLNWAVLLRARV